MPRFLVACALLAALAMPVRSEAEELCLPDYMVGQITFRPPTRQSDVTVHRGGHRFSPQSGQCLMNNDRIEVAGNGVAQVVTNSESIRLGSGQGSRVWTAPQKQIARQALHDDMALLRALGKLFESRTITRQVVSQSGLDECMEPSSLQTPLAALRNIPEGRQKIGSDLRALAIGWKQDTGAGFVEVTLTRGKSSVVNGATRVCWKFWTMIDLPPGLRTGELLHLKAVDAQGNKLAWELEVCPPDRLPAPGEGAGTDVMLGFWRLLRGPEEYRVDALSRLGRDKSDLASPRAILGAVFADVPLEGAKE